MPATLSRTRTRADENPTILRLLRLMPPGGWFRPTTTLFRHACLSATDRGLLVSELRRIEGQDTSADHYRLTDLGREARRTGNVVVSHRGSHRTLA